MVLTGGRQEIVNERRYRGVSGGIAMLYFLNLSNVHFVILHTAVQL